MTIKSHEDKTFIGAFIASLTLPWGFSVSDDTQGAGYHFVWARDMYEEASTILAAGDREAANNAVTWLFTHQQLPDGTFPQNSKVDGTPSQTNLQLDEVGFPLVLAWQLNRTDDATWNGVGKAANAIVANGPITPEERWEETGGYSPSTIAAEIAGLTAAADLARLRGDSAHSLFWTGVADAWQRSTEKWMFTTTGNVGDGRYYVRITPMARPMTAPQNGSLASQRSVAVSGTTNGQLVLVGVAGTVYTSAPQNGAFNVTVPLALGGNLITLLSLRLRTAVLT